MYRIGPDQQLPRNFTPEKFFLREKELELEKVAQFHDGVPEPGRTLGDLGLAGSQQREFGDRGVLGDHAVLVLVDEALRDELPQEKLGKGPDIWKS